MNSKFKLYLLTQLDNNAKCKNDISILSEITDNECAKK